MNSSSVAFATSLLCCSLLMLEAAQADEQASTTLIGGVPVYSLRINRGDAFAVMLNDQVTNGCWLTSEDTKSAVALELARSGYALADLKDAEIILYLSAIGWDTGDGYCAVSYEASAIMGTGDRFYSDQHEVISLVHSTVWTQRGLVTAGKRSVHSLVKEKLLGATQEFLVEVSKGQRRALKSIRANAGEAGGARHYWVSYGTD